MFIPRGKAIYEGLATTYVLVDALVADLCEGGFSGFVEVVLRDTDANVLIADGKVLGVLEQRGVTRRGELNRRNYSKATVTELAARSRYERGRVSIYSCSSETVMTVAGLSGAEQLYAQLSTEFADVEKMINKLSRERDRQWFIELSTGDGTSSLIHLKGDRCRLISSHREAGERESETAGPANNSELTGLLETCARHGGVFDVYFRGAHEEVTPVEITAPLAAAVAMPVTVPSGPLTPQRSETAAEKAAAGAPGENSGGEVREAAADEQGTYESLIEAAGEHVAGAHALADPIPPSSHELAEARLEALSRASRSEEPMAKAAATPEIAWQPAISEHPPAEAVPGDMEELAVTPNEPQAAGGDLLSDAEVTEESLRVTSAPPIPEKAAFGPRVTASEGLPRHTTGLSAIRHELEASSDVSELTEAQIMNDVKRLMSEIARTIEESARTVDQRDTFSIYLRAGQLKVAERYPFLDPFGAEFEYLSGEIAFIGSAAPWEFIEGLTEALRLAVEGVVQASAQGARIRAQITEDLRGLLERNKAEFIEYGLDGSIEKIIAA